MELKSHGRAESKGRPGAARALTGCGGRVDVVMGTPPRVAYEAIQVDSSDDPDAHQVERDGATLANVMSTSLIDTSVTTSVHYCYRVTGFNLSGDVIAISDPSCIVLAP